MARRTNADLARAEWAISECLKHGLHPSGIPELYNRAEAALLQGDRTGFEATLAEYRTVREEMGRSHA